MSFPLGAFRHYTLQNVVISLEQMALLKYNDKGQLLEHESYCEDPLGAQVTVYTESLLSLPGPGDNVQA
ncbi:F-box/kelch-repeat protein [Trifolium pratense]|uniref:F-box/kelch-repeat protein n=1 Tax=Trifolium pratense TaxID=57577 RepID=A0A2K3KJY2_TRIPR|nr:F-box/kelch-repeat protein [Trifolium pratense]